MFHLLFRNDGSFLEMMEYDKFLAAPKPFFCFAMCLFLFFLVGIAIMHKPQVSNHGAKVAKCGKGLKDESS